MHSLIATRGRRSAASLPKRGYPSVAVQLLRTGRPSEYQVVDVRSGRSYCFIRAHPETERDRLPAEFCPRLLVGTPRCGVRELGAMSIAVLAPCTA